MSLSISGSQIAGKLLPLVRWIATTALLSPFYAGYAIWCGGAAVGDLFRRGRLVRRSLRPSLACPGCGEANATSGRWRCRGCSSVYLGWVGRCRVCSAGALAFTCAHCRASIPLGLP